MFVCAPIVMQSGPGLYCCTFTLAFEVPGVYYIASCYPYTYTDLHEHLGLLCHKLNQQQRAPQCQPPVPGSQDSQPGTRPGSGSPSQAQPAGGMLVRSPLCYSLRGVGCEVITITDYCAPAEVIRQREAVVVTARVHPGETCASWIMQGLLDFLTSPAPQAVLLRSAFVIKCVPMLNPDGVINGSYRCSMVSKCGQQWRATRKLIIDVFFIFSYLWISWFWLHVAAGRC